MSNCSFEYTPDEIEPNEIEINVNLKEYAFDQMPYRVRLKPKRRKNSIRDDQDEDDQDEDDTAGDCKNLKFDFCPLPYQTPVPNSAVNLPEKNLCSVKTSPLKSNGTVVDADTALIKQTGRLTLTSALALLGNKVEDLDLEQLLQHIGKTNCSQHFARYLPLSRFVLLAPALYKFYAQKTSIVMGIPESRWNDIFTYLSVQDLKAFRSVSRATNYLVDHSFNWAVDLCFIHDEKIHPRTHNNPVIPQEQICEDESVGRPDVRIRHFESPFSGKKYFSETFNSRNQITKTLVYSNVKKFEIYDCTLHWTDLLEAIGCLSNLQELIYIHSKRYLCHNNVLKAMRGNFADHTEITSALKRGEFKRYRSFKTSVSKHLKCVQLQALNLGITNFIIAVLHQLCKNLADLKIIFLEDLFLHYPGETTRTLDSSLNGLGTLDAWLLIHDNQKTLKTLQVGFLDEMRNRRMEPCYFYNNRSTMIRIAPLLSYAVWPEHERLKLTDLIVEIPLALAVPDGIRQNKMWSKFIGKTEVVRRHEDDLLDFCASQLPTLNHLCLKSLDDECYHMEKLLRSPITTHIPDRLKIGKAIYCTNETINWDLMHKACYDLFIYLDDNSLPYESIFAKDMPIMRNCYTLQIEATKSCPLPTFHITQLILKFPQLTRLVLVDGNCRDSQKYDIAPKVTDVDMQAIIYFLPWLVELVIQCNMSEVTDFGMTGIIRSARQRMQNQGQFTILPGDVCGLSFSTLKCLKVLELHGLGSKVTGVTANLGFENSSLLELYLCSPKFTKRQKKELKERLAYKKNFKIIII